MPSAVFEAGRLVDPERAIRHTDVVGVFRDPAALLRLAGASWLRLTTNGKAANAATSGKAPWPCSPPRHLIRMM
jgi:hypothetical protein